MAELLLEILSDEIPARMHINARKQLLDNLKEKLDSSHIIYDKLETFISSRRLVAYADNLSLQETSAEEIRGPRADANKNAVEGFAKKYNKTIDDLKIITTDKGDFYFLIQEAGNLSLDQLLTNIINEVIKNFSWPKSMRWGSINDTWVRPIKSIICLFDGKVLPVSYANINAGRISIGNRMLSPNNFEVRYFIDYQENLKKNLVMLDYEMKLDFIKEEIELAAKDHKSIIKEDQRLLQEVAGLVEWPKILVASFKEDYLKIPEVIIVTAMKVHQRYFPLYNPAGSKLHNKCIIVANCANPAKDQVISGNEKVLNARLSDAKFFYEADISTGILEMTPKLSNIMFHEKIGSMADKIARVKKIALLIAAFVEDADPEIIDKATDIMKSDLASKVVGEFPELQGIIGEIYAQHAGYSNEISKIVKEHYYPIGNDDNIPSSLEASIVAIADKLDNIMSFFSIGERPTGSKDPYALRRSAIGIIKIMIEHNITLPVNTAFGHIVSYYDAEFDLQEDVVEFLYERLKYLMKAGNIDVNLISSVIQQRKDSILSTYKIILDISSIFSDNKYKDSINALIRVLNILKDAEDIEPISKTKVKVSLFEKDEESILYNAINDVSNNLDELYAIGNYKEYIIVLCGLKNQINNFFNNVIVNASEDNIRNNRLAILKLISDSILRIADLSLIS